MSTEITFSNDARTIDELVNAALSESDEELEWNYVCSLQGKGTREVLKRAELLTKSKCSRERRLGADILGQLGVQLGFPDRSFSEQCEHILRSMLRDGEEALVLESVLIGLSHQHDHDAVHQVVKFSTHSDSAVRRATVLALSRHDSPLAIEALIKLTTDSCSHVRDWATFALGTQLETNSDQFRAALAERLDDPDDDTRAEAIVGLASRKDERVIAALKKELDLDSVGRLVVEVAEVAASAELYPLLVALRSWWDVDPELLERAIAASQS